VDIKEKGCEDIDWIHVAQDKDQWLDFVNTNEPSCSIKHGKFLD